MDKDNNARRLKKRLLIEIAKMAMQDNLTKNIDKLVYRLFPKDKKSVRCCIHKDRAVTKYRIQAILGYRAEDEVDESKQLSEYLEEANSREKIEDSSLTVLSEACSACVKGRHFVTNVCKGCVARPCTVTCPKGAVKMIDNQAIIDEELCVDCGKCLKACPYHAIVYIPIPCEDACPVGAITKDSNGIEVIDEAKCINCGKCVSACPFGAITERSQLIDVINEIKSDRKVAALIAPAIVGQFPYAFGKIISATKQLGFDKVYEVATGAKDTSIAEAKELEHKLAEGQKFMTTSCCPAYMQLAEKHIPEIQEFVSDTPTPMHYTGKISKEADNDMLTVFISPCPAKRSEAFNDETIDYVISVEEYGAMLVAAGIEIEECDHADAELDSEVNGRGFPLSGGVAKAVVNFASEDTKVEPVIINGIDKKSITLLKVYAKNRCPGNLVEVMSCAGGCVGGCNTLENSIKAKVKIEKYLK